jgi:hypothetical protein
MALHVARSFGSNRQRRFREIDTHCMNIGQTIRCQRMSTLTTTDIQAQITGFQGQYV